MPSCTWPIRSTIQIRVLTHHQYEIFVLIPKMPFCWEIIDAFRAVTKISSCWVNSTTSRWGIKQLHVGFFFWFYFSSIFL